MTGRRVCWMVAAILGMTACAHTVPGGARPASPVAATVEVGLLPIPPSTSTIAASAGTVPTTTPPTAVPPTASVQRQTPTVPTTTSAPPKTSTTARVDPSTTSCATLAYIGDSVSLGMMSPETLPDPAARLDARLAQIGVADLLNEISGGRSIVETLPGQENAVSVASRLRAAGFSGCWVIAVGTNDAANIAAGGAKQADQRIASLMSVLGADRVLWIDAATVANTGYWASPNIEAWNVVLRTAAAVYPNMRVAPWSSFVGQQWFTSDGVHLNSAGAAARVQFVANALLANFPKKGR